MLAEPTGLPTWLTALIVFASAQLAMVIPLWFSSRRKSKDAEEAIKAKQEEAAQALKAKQEDWKRQDEVARRVEETAAQTADAARLLLQRQELDSLKTAEAARLLLASNERVAANSGEVTKKLDVIHDLVNSKMTEAMQGQLEETVRSLASLEEIVDLKKAAGRQPSEESLGVIKATKERIAELQARVRDRLAQQASIDAKKR